MATVRQRKNGTWEVTIRNKALPKPYYYTFDHETEARDFVSRIECQLNEGKIPESLQEPLSNRGTIGGAVNAYLEVSHVSAHDHAILTGLPHSIKVTPLNGITVRWGLSWVAQMHSLGIAPGSIKKKIGAVARCLDWHILNKTISHNPLREMPRNYAAYPATHEKKRFDIERDRRLEPGEEEKILEVIKGSHEWELLYTMSVETGMRLREMFTLEWSQVQLDKKTIFLDKTKNGDKRQVPLSSVIYSMLKSCEKKEGLVYTFWDGKQESLKRTTSRISNQWYRIAKQAGCHDLHFHDLRHTAVCRFYERTTLSDVQIALITGHKTLIMLKRYANLRGSDLSSCLW